jgi:hypothetical protein
LNIYLTYDYELFFGKETGTAEQCILAPTNKLIEVAKRTGVQLTFFIDVGYIKQLRAHSQFNSVYQDYQRVVKQIKTLVAQGHDCQLHIHPHWEDSYHDGKEWIMNTKRYKLTDFSEADILKIVLEYQKILSDITHQPVNKYRAGGWCLQPFSKVKTAFDAAGLYIDSTVFLDGKNTIAPYYYNFTKCPKKDSWRFSDELCTENLNGQFIEYPISAYKYSALFFWRLFLLGRLKPKSHKPIGNGFPLPSVGMRKEMLTKGKCLSASCDGYFVTKLNAICNRNAQRGWEHTVVIGHPKALTRYSIAKLESFIKQQQNKGHVFTVFDRD